MLDALDLKASYDEAVRCNRCGFCQAVCPTYQVTGQEAGTARGRNAVCRALIEGRLLRDRTVERVLSECLLCGACTSACFPAVRTSDLVVRARQQYRQLHGQGRLERYALRRLLPEPDRLGRLARLLAVGKRTGASGAVQAFRYLGTFGQHLAAAEDFVERVPRRFLREHLARIDRRPLQRRLRVAYFIGCGINFALPEAGLATVRVLRALGCELVLADHVCCGLPAYAYGDIEAAQAMARKNAAVLAGLDVDAIVTDCSSCASFLKDYGTLLSADAVHAPAGAQVSRLARDFTELAAALGPAAPGHAVDQTVAYHRPCHQVRYQKLSEEPIRLLDSAPGVRYVKLAEDDWCCGGAGSYSIAQHELSLKVLDRKMRHVAATGAGVLVSSCPSCLLQLAYGVRRHALPIQVRHISEILCERLSR